MKKHLYRSGVREVTERNEGDPLFQGRIGFALGILALLVLALSLAKGC